MLLDTTRHDTSSAWGFFVVGFGEGEGVRLSLRIGIVWMDGWGWLGGYGVSDWGFLILARHRGGGGESMGYPVSSEIDF